MCLLCIYKSIDLQSFLILNFSSTDAMINVKSPPKEIKTNKNLQMRHQFQEPVPSFLRTDALSPTWTLGRKNDILFIG